jgi:transcription termination factor Rho
LEANTLDGLRTIAKELSVSGFSRLKKSDLILQILRHQAESQGLIFGGGVLEIIQDGIGFLRSVDLLPGPDDIYVSQSQIRRFGLTYR